MDLHEDWKEFLRLLNSHEVEYLIIGAHALAFHGSPRLTGDLDFFVGPSEENVTRLYRALEDFGFGSVLPPAESLLFERKVLMLGRPPYRIDILNDITGVPFEQAWMNRVLGEVEGIPVPFIARDDLVANKRASGRAKDVADLEALE